jgi:hypothetical protein
MTLIKKLNNTKGSRDHFKTTAADKCYLGDKTVNLVMNPEKALLLAEGILKAVNAGKKKIDLRVCAPNHGAIESGKGLALR